MGRLGSNAAAVHAQENGRSAWPVFIAVFAILAAHVVGRVGSFCAPTRADSYLYGAIACRMAQGEMLYSPTLSDVKPPGVYALYAVAYTVLPASRSSMIPVESIISVLGYYAVYCLARELYRSGVALVVTVTFAVVTNAFMALDFATEAFGLAETFLVLPSALAAVMYIRATHRVHTPSFLWVGVVLGMALLVKQTGLTLCAAIVLHTTLEWHVRREPLRRWLDIQARLLAGVSLALIPVALLLMVQGTWLSAVHATGPQAARLMSRESAWPGPGDVRTLWGPLALCVLGLSRHFGSRFAKRDSDSLRAIRRRTTCIRFLMVWITIEAVSLTLLPLRAYHYYIPLCLPVCVLSGLFWQTLREMPVPARYRATAVAAALSIAAARPTVNEIVPIAMTRFRSYDTVRDHGRFRELLAQPRLLLGPAEAGEPGAP